MVTVESTSEAEFRTEGYDFSQRVAKEKTRCQRTFCKGVLLCRCTNLCPMLLLIVQSNPSRQDLFLVYKDLFVK